jgi:hypothetical protein
VLLGLSALVKETAVFIAFALLTYIVFFGDGNRWHRVFSAVKVGLVVGLVFIAGLQAYDSAVATNSTPTFVQEVSYMLSYGSSLIAHQLACQPTTGYWCKFANDPGGPPILPTDWLLYFSPVTYYGTSVSVCPNSVNGVCKGGAYTYVSLAYYGVTNEVVTWTVFVWVPLVGYALYRQFRRKEPVPPPAAPGGELDHAAVCGWSEARGRDLRRGANEAAAALAGLLLAVAMFFMQLIVNIVGLSLHLPQGPLALLVLLGSGICMLLGGLLAVRFYHRRRPEIAIVPSMGARLGVVTGMLGFFFYGIPQAIGLALSRSVPETMRQAIEQAAAQTPDPRAQEVMHKLMSPGALAAFVTVLVVLFFVCFLVLASLGGAIGASVWGRKQPS